jgi:hypothetical protein
MNQSFSRVDEVSTNPLLASGRANEPKIYAYLEIAFNTENKTFDHFTSISGQASARNREKLGLPFKIFEDV